MNNNHQSSGLEQSAENGFLEFAQASLDLVRELGKEATVRSGPLRVVFIPKGWGYSSEDSLMFRALVIDNLDRFQALPSFPPCLEQHEVADIFSFHDVVIDGQIIDSERKGQRDYFLRTLLEPVLHAVETTRTLDLHREQLLDVYRVFCGEWTTTVLPWETTVPLMNFESNLASPYTTGDGLQLKPLGLKDKEVIWRTASRHLEDILGVGAFAKTEFRLSVPFTLNRADEKMPIEDKPNVEKIARFITALRLWQSGRVGAVAAFTFPVTVGPKASFGTSTIPDYEVGTWGETYTLKEADLPSIVSVYDKLGDPAVTRLAVALRRYNQSYTRGNGDDQLIDLAISLESSLMAGAGRNPQIAKILAPRGASLLSASKGYTDTGQTQLLLETIYQARNKIVHEGLSLWDNPVTVKSMVPKMAEIDPHFNPISLPDQALKLTRAILNEYLVRMGSGNSLEIMKSPSQQAARYRKECGGKPPQR